MSIDKKTLLEIPYTNLHAHTHFSLLDGVGTIKDHIQEALSKGHRGFCITDHGNMSGCIQLHKLAKDPDFLEKIGRKDPVPNIMGAELYISKDLAERDPTNKYNHITILAKNETGYKNLCYLTSIASTDDHFYTRPRIGLNELIEHKEGLIVTTGCFIGIIPQAISKETGEEEQLMKLFKDTFGDDFYVELHITDIRMKWDRTLKTHVDQGFNPQEKVNIRLLELAKKFDVKVLIAQDSHMPKKEHLMLQDIMIWNSPSGKDGWHFSDAYYIMSVPELYEKSKILTPYVTDDEFIEYCKNSEDVLNGCKNCSLTFEPRMPLIDYMNHPVNKNPQLEEKLCYLEDAFKGLDDKFVYILVLSKTDLALRTALKVIINNNKIDITNDDYRNRLVEEILVIQRNGIIKLVDYFMLLEDVTSFVRQNGYARGFGRGSGAGSLFNYCLDITDVDPLVWNLLFERFLVKQRVGELDFSVPEVPKK